MKIGLVHGRFQPFHRGHRYLVRKMLSECNIGVILIGSVGSEDKEKNPLSFSERLERIKRNFPDAYIGGNYDLPENSKSWDILLGSCVLSLTGYFPTDVYAGPGYGIQWDRDRVTVNMAFSRYMQLSGTAIRNRFRKIHGI